jgi:hypothetical protein
MPVRPIAGPDAAGILSYSATIPAPGGGANRPAGSSMPFDVNPP